MTTRTTQVSSEATQTGRRAGEVLDGTTALNTRCGKAEARGDPGGPHVQRRGGPARLSSPPVPGRCHDRCQGQSAKAVIRDISEGGCLAETALRGQAGQRIELILSRFGKRLHGSVVHASEGKLRIAFSDDGLQAGDADRISVETIPDLVRLTKEDHVAFVKHVVDIVEAREKPPQAGLATAHHCRLGRWYDGISDHDTLALVSFKALEEPHHAVHDFGRRALAALTVDDMAAAQRDVAAMREASGQVMEGLDAFGREFPSTIRAGRQMPADRQRSMAAA